MSTRRIAPCSRILLVEDNPDDILSLYLIVDKTSPRVLLTVAADGDEAVDLLEKLDPPPSLILLDVQLPGRSGLDVLGWIRARSEFIRVPVVMLTGCLDSAVIKRALSLGANSYLVKPSTFAALQEMIRSLVCYWCGMNESGGCP